MAPIGGISMMLSFIIIMIEMLIKKISKVFNFKKINYKQSRSLGSFYSVFIVIIFVTTIGLQVRLIIIESLKNNNFIVLAEMYNTLSNN